MLRISLSVALITVATLVCYRGILFVPSDVQLYPWASDTLGHVMKTEFILEQIQAGQPIPTLFPEWYMGLQILRYYPPLPYLLLVGLSAIIGSSVVAANWFIAFCALAGGLTWLLYERWVGWLPATAGGILYLFLPDNVRVALAEGNLPRVLAAALLPLTVYFLLRALEDGGTRWHRGGLAICFACVTLSHAMAAAIFGVCCVMLGLIVWVGRVTTLRQVALAAVSIFLGLMLAGWWLLPSLTGGITELNSEAMTAAQHVFSLRTYLNPSLRLGNPEIVYPGMALLLIAAVLLLVPRGRTGWTVGLTVVGLSGILISTSGFNTLFNALPLHHLLWPIRFLGFAGFALLLAIVWRARNAGPRYTLPALLVFGLLVADGAGSLHLVHARPARDDVLESAERLPTLPGWREATLDYGRLGSAPAYFFTSTGRREQLYGWAYQGARTAVNVASLNEAMQQDFMSYLIDRLMLYGVDDLVVLRLGNQSHELSPALTQAGFISEYSGPDVTLYHRDGGPRAYKANWRVLGIGRGAQNISYLFPQVIQGTQRQVDAYSLEELRAYDTLVLSGFQWHDRQKAEQLVCDAADAGVQVVVDLTGIPPDPLAREPRFLGVWGEYISLPSESIVLEGVERSYQLEPFSSDFPFWQTHTPQGLDQATLYYDYLEERSPVVGCKECDNGRVWFIGFNLPYHMALTRDPAVISILSEFLGVAGGEPQDYTPVPLLNYSPSHAGYSFSYALEESDPLLVPVAHHEGTVVEVDGYPVHVTSFENLVAFDAPAGEHSVTIGVTATPIYTFGKLATLFGILGVLGLTLPSRKLRVSYLRGEDNGQN